MPPSPPVPRFLRVTQTLALVSGISVAPAALVVACSSNHDGGVLGSAACAEACGTAAYDGGPVGTTGDAGHDAAGDAGHDAAPEADAYDGMATGVDSGPGDASGDAAQD
jgi:hypothetical protein